MTAILDPPRRLRLAAGRGAATQAGVIELAGRPVGWFRISGGPHRGAIGEAEGEIACRLIDHALELGIPIVGVLATSGAEIGGGIASLHAWGRMAERLARASGVVPIVLDVVGPCVSGPALLLGIADFVIMADGATSYVSGPRAVTQFTGIMVEHEDLGGVRMHERRSGIAALTAMDEADALALAGLVLAYLPPNNLTDPPATLDDDPPERRCETAAAIVPTAPSASYDMRELLTDVCDQGSFLELWGAYASNMVTGLAALGGRPVGVIANQPCQRAGTIDIEASRKAARLVQRCDAFNVPLATFVDTPGFEPGKDLEWRGMIRHGAELVMAYAEATVPRLCVVVRKAYGGAYIVMDSKNLGNDLCVAWPRAEIAVLGATAAVQVLHGKRLARHVDAGEQRARLEDTYTRTYCTPEIAARRGYVDEIIDPASTRAILIEALDVLSGKRDQHPRRRHSNTPL